MKLTNNIVTNRDQFYLKLTLFFENAFVYICKMLFCAQVLHNKLKIKTLEKLWTVFISFNVRCNC